jgi:hypothetical protein
VTAHEELFETLLDMLSQRVAAKIIDAVGPPPDERPLLTLDQVGARLRVSRRSVDGMVLSDPPKLESIVVGSTDDPRSRRVAPAELDRYLRWREAEERERRAGRV